MSSVWILVFALGWYAVAYRWYGRHLARIIGVDPTVPTPATIRNDGVDYVPAKNWLVLFGHHFSSICGAGPIIGPALAVIYWGWVPSLLWIVVGAILMGAVSDFTSLFISVRSDGRSIPQIARPEISPRARLLFSWFILLALVLVNAVFAIFAARTFIQAPEAVIPSVGLIPIAVFVGYLLYRTKLHNGLATMIGLVLLAMAIEVGSLVPVELPTLFGISAEWLWIVVLMSYCAVASVTPVQLLLQPRDYLASFLLFAAIGIGVLSVFVTAPQMQAAAVGPFVPQDWAAAGPMWPMLFVTIACGAISGFHTLVSSGTTCKQLATEGHACRIGYGGMLTESLVGVLVVICVGAALAPDQAAPILQAGGPISAFSEGYGTLSKPLLGGYGTVFAIMALNAFILTTLDTSTRIGRYLIQELFEVENKHVATGFIVVASTALALTGQWTKIWPAFGAANQLIGALALLVVSCWLMKRGRKVAYTLVPACIMLLTTLAAFCYQLYGALMRIDAQTGQATPDWFIAAVVTTLIVLALVVFWEGVKVLLRGETAGEAAVV
jgi:carbon starvation protein